MNLNLGEFQACATASSRFQHQSNDVTLRTAQGLFLMVVFALQLVLRLSRGHWETKMKLAVSGSSEGLWGPELPWRDSGPKKWNPGDPGLSHCLGFTFLYFTFLPTLSLNLLFSSFLHGITLSIDKHPSAHPLNTTCLFWSTALNPQPGSPDITENSKRSAPGTHTAVSEGKHCQWGKSFVKTG